VFSNQNFEAMIPCSVTVSFDAIRSDLGHFAGGELSELSGRAGFYLLGGWDVPLKATRKLKERGV
jgi:hypothetical protein